MSKTAFPLLKYIALLATASLVACATPQANSNDPQTYYNAAIADAAIATPEKIADLKPLPEGQTITVISWVNDSRAPCRVGETPCELSVGADRLWVTLAGEVQTTCRAWHLSGDPLRRRLEQLLGLPQDPPSQYRKTTFITIEVARERLERACLGVDTSDPAHPRCTFYSMPNTSIELRNFVGQQMAGSYIVGNPKGPGYPFTRLGYTYDWHPSSAAQRHYGASEFLIAPNTKAKAVAQVSTDEYCAP